MSAETTPAPASTQGRRVPPYDREMTLLEHLNELRQRLIICGIALLAGMAIAIAVPFPGAGSLTWAVIGALVAPAGGAVQAIRPGETIFTYLQVALITGAALAMPIIIYQVMAFILPALLEEERKLLFLAVPGVTVSFAAGIAFSYFVLVPFAVRFLLNFGSEIIPPHWSFSEYVGTVALLLFYMGVIFELPLVMFTLAKLGVVDVARLQSLRKWALLIAFILGAIITPTPDPLNQTLIALPVYLLFEIGILLARMARR